MYVGHLGVALAAKSTRDDVPVWVFVGAALALEPFEHRVVLGLLVPVLVGLVAWRMVDAGLGLAVTVVALSHLPLDLVTSHLELTAGGPERGLGWYRYPILDFAIEASLVVAGWALYVRRREAPWARGASPSGLLASLLGAQAVFSFAVAPNVV